HESEKGQVKNTASAGLWQARLLLKLGERVDRSQAEIRRNLDRMTRQQIKLFKELRQENKQGDDDNLSNFSLPDLSVISHEEAISSEQQVLRLKAWARLFALSQESFTETVFISSSSDAVEALLEQYRKKYSRTAEQTATIALPLFGAGKENILLRRDRLQEEAGALLNAIRYHIMKPGESFFSKKNEAIWIDVLERHYPAAEYGRCALILYFLPDVRPQDLFLETFAAQDEFSFSANAAGEQSEKGSGIALGLLEK
ncbi:MAG: hypothetical protein D3904_09395, partial [Candidatus Electrothrix sp. EH2]|nr:hypothetical protein [Candidatus Electrothrix sp. EH2]